MKKFFALVAFCLAMITVQAAVPAPIQSFVDEYNAEAAGQSADGIRLGRCTISGNDIIIPMYIDDSELVAQGFTLKDAIDMMGGQEAVEQVMLQAIFEDTDPESSENIAMLKRYQYNLVLRMIGSASKTKVDFRIRYQDL
jgi:hypothetical protein